MSLLVVAGSLAACDRHTELQRAEATDSSAEDKELTPIVVDGSSTVDLLSQAVLDLYASQLTHDIKLNVSGTGGGFKKFCNKESDINGASRPITSVEEKLCAENGVKFVELPVAYDGIAVVVSRHNEWLKSLTTDELAKLWSSKSEGLVTTWKQVRPSFPEQPIHLYGPGIESGTFDFFGEAILGAPGSSRADYKSSENDHELAAWIGQDEDGLGYFGLAYFRKYEKNLRLVAVDDENAENGDGPVLPTPATVGNGHYAPLSRPLFLYVESEQLKRPEVLSFVQFYLRSARLVAPDVGYVGLGRDVLQLAEARLAQEKTGTVFSGVHSVVGLTILDLMQAEEDSVAEARAPQPHAKNEVNP